MTVIKGKLDDRQFKKVIKDLERNAINTLPVMREISRDMEESADRNIEAGGREPRWKPLHPLTVIGKQMEGRSPKTMIRSGRLAASITSRATKTTAIAGTNLIYARIQQLGGKTRPHVIKVKRKKSLRWFNINRMAVFAKSVNHPGSKIPARPFLKLTKKEIQESIQKIAKHLLRKIKRR